MSSEDDDKYTVYCFETKLSLTEEEKSRLIFHSFTNMLNVLLGLILLLLLYFLFRYNW
jgi:hypothetical protein